MARYDIKKPNIEAWEGTTLIVGISCRSVRGFLFMWLNILHFLWATAKAKGCVGIIPGILSPFSIQLISYWQSPSAMQAFVGSRAHIKWMRFIARHPSSLNLFNETYGAPISANYINRARGIAHACNQHIDREQLRGVG